MGVEDGMELGAGDFHNAGSIRGLLVVEVKEEGVAAKEQEGKIKVSVKLASLDQFPYSPGGDAVLERGEQEGNTLPFFRSAVRRVTSRVLFYRAPGFRIRDVIFGKLEGTVFGDAMEGGLPSSSDKSSKRKAEGVLKLLAVAALDAELIFSNGTQRKVDRAGIGDFVVHLGLG